MLNGTSHGCHAEHYRLSCRTERATAVMLNATNCHAERSSCHAERSEASVTDSSLTLRMTEERSVTDEVPEAHTKE